MFASRGTVGVQPARSLSACDVSVGSVSSCTSVKGQRPTYATVVRSSRFGIVDVRRPSCPSPGRLAAVHALKKQSASLVSVLKDELKYERESYRKEETLLQPPPNDFELQDMSGRCSFFLTKQYKTEVVIVTCNIESQPDPDDENDEDEDEGVDENREAFMGLPPVEFQVSITKDNGTLIFECTGTGDDLSIQHLTYQSKDIVDESGEPLGEEAYVGPVFEELDETLQQAFIYYLEERGVNPELCEYLQLMAEDKMALEYQTWLEKVRDFVAK